VWRRVALVALVCMIAGVSVGAGSKILRSPEDVAKDGGVAFAKRVILVDPPPHPGSGAVRSNGIDDPMAEAVRRDAYPPAHFTPNPQSAHGIWGISAPSPS
jgi:hypothetical protein